MNEGSSEKRARPSDATMAFLLEVGRQRSLTVLREKGMDAIGKSSMETGNLLLQFLDSHADVAKEFLERSGVHNEDLREKLLAEHSPESPPGPRRLPENPTDEQRKLHELMQKSEAEREERGDAAPFSGAVRAALKKARDEATEAGSERFSLASLIVSVIETESHAQTVFRSLTEESRLADALRWLRDQPDLPGQGPLLSIDRIRAQVRETIDVAWPGIQRQSSEAMGERSRQLKDELYAKNPAAYEEPLDVAAKLAERQLPPEKDYLWRGGVLLHAAANEARIRRAPEVTLDHLLVALLRDGTDTAEFLDGLGVDRTDWSRRMDQELPRLDEGPRWPPNARDLGMSIHTNHITRMKPLPDGKTFESLTKEEIRNLVERTYDFDLRFTDLRFLVKLPEESRSIGYRLFAEAGITEDQLKAEITAREKGDRDWWRKPFDLVKAMDEAEPGVLGVFSARAHLCQKAAQFEARMRGAPVIEYEDLLVALLVPGTDMAGLVESLGEDLDELRREVDLLRPRFDKGPMFPESDEFHLNPISSTLVKKGWSDLMFLRNVLREPTDRFPGLELLRSKGVTLEAVDAWLVRLGVEVL